ncbi:sigma E protease regulator RseP [Candidatus Fukatsuia symbiotica]|uniref:Zinc metalloprotease n=1 Tax=Candidatus Fukatsuia symbiotica TaxID=1878942 RepID=A0A2U8I799_9GAMM|nr:sigma E protease regulator RseP [Candidatus Fukatsuia symbiotica]AWK15040.1 RIP metalloprotease RseP [Candidatus Fukatsuia symbiotica]MEA9443843.1 sigma E protease regulator RseP [Candidatus Fukatsuia symbiotica]
MIHILWSLSAFILALGVLITVHEFGHFWVARRCGVKVECFSIGFGKPLWQRIDRQGTKYVVALIPLGGYVKMLDESITAVAPEFRHQAFNNKTILQRAAIISAGPIANFLFAILAYWLVFVIGVPSVRPVVGDVLEQSIAAQARILPGMELKTVDNRETRDWDAVRLALMGKIGDDQVKIGVTPPGSGGVVQKILDLKQWKFEADKQDPIATLGILPLGPQVQSVLAEVRSGSAAQKAGLQVGDKIVKVGNQLVNSWSLFVTLIRNNPNKPLALEIERKGTPLFLTLIPDAIPGDITPTQGFAGVVPQMIPLAQEYRIVRQYDPLSALYQAFDQTWQLTRLTVNMLRKLITGDVKLNNLSGPISIAQGAGASAQYGFVYYLMFLALISVNLGIINLFPLPVLDGGHLLFLTIEKLKGEPLSERVQDVSFRIGSILLVLLMGLALFNDFSRF